MKFFVALVAFSAVIVLAIAAPNPQPVSLLSPYNSWPAGRLVYGGGGSHISGYASGYDPALLSLNIPGLVGANVLGYNPGYPVVWH